MITEIKKIVRRKEYLAILLFLFTSVIMDFYVSVSAYKGMGVSHIPSAYQMTILSSNDSMYHIVYDSFLFFLISDLIAVPALIEEADHRIINYTASRVSIHKYLKRQICAVSLVTFLTVWVCLMINLLLCLSAFPLQGYFTEVTTHNRLMNPDPDRLFGYLYRYYPYINIVVLITLRAIIAAVSSFLSSSIAVLNKVPGFVSLMVPMIVFVVYSILTDAISLRISDIRWSGIIGTYMLPMNHSGSEVMIALYFLAEAVIGYALIKREIKNDSLVL